VLYHFTGGSDGGNPLEQLYIDAKGNLYGVASGGNRSGSLCEEYGCGVIFEMTPTDDGHWDYRVIHTFCADVDCADGAYPGGGLIADAAGSLYGVTVGGGNPPKCGGIGCGVVYRLSRNPNGEWGFKVLHVFQGGATGSYLDGLLAFDAAGNLYGDAANGGTTGGSCEFSNGCGLIYRLTPDPRGTQWSEKVLYIFTGGRDGALPQGGLVLDSAGNVYGTAEAGGIRNPTLCVLLTCGVVFQLKPNPDRSWSYNIIHRFTGSSDGATPVANMIFDSAGNLYGTSIEGNFGDVFEFLPNSDGSWREKVIGGPGGNTYAPVVMDASGNLYGTTSNGLFDSLGFIFQFVPSGHGTWRENYLYGFCSLSGCRDGATSYAGLAIDSQGNLYGVTYGGGNYNYGVVFQLRP
jgi:uncharacterized repeat protein (TIGR03803 family)